MSNKRVIDQRLKPIDKEPTTFELGSFDIEGVGGPGGYITGGVMVDGNYYEFEHQTKLLEFIRQRRFKSYRFAAHNLVYDFGILEPWLNDDDYPLLINGRPFKVRLANGQNNPRFLVDSLLFSAGLPLRKVGEAIKKPKLNTPPELTGDYDNAVEWECEEHHIKWCMECYLKRDCEIVYDYMLIFQNTINDLGGELKFTLASTAMDLFRREFLREEYRTPFPSRNEYARKAYYGGRVEPYKTGNWSHINVYDINSLYPFVMRSYQYPDPNYLHGPLDIVPDNVIFDYEGVSDVTIEIKDCYIPPLPYRHEDKLYFPVGCLRGHYTHVEIRKALSLGAKLLDVHTTLYSEKTCNPFVSYVDTLYDMRLALKAANDPRELVIKILLNSLYGKFGQRTSAGLQEIRSFLWWYNGNQHIPVEFREIDGNLTVLLDKASDNQPEYINTLWASYVTSYARILLLDYMLAAGSNLLYCDTDSVFIEGELETSKALGAMKLVYNNVDVEIFGPKAYRLSQQGEYIEVKCKGVPHDHSNDFLDNGVTTFSRPVGLLEAGHRKPHDNGTPYYPSEWINITKQQHYQEPKRCLVPCPTTEQENFLTVPHFVETLP